MRLSLIWFGVVLLLALIAAACGDLHTNRSPTAAAANPSPALPALPVVPPAKLAKPGGAIDDTRPTPQAQPNQWRSVVVARWAAITDQRRDVLDLTLADVVRILRGDDRNWSVLGGSAQPLIVFLPAAQAVRIATALGLSVSELKATLLPDEQLIERVAATPGAFALVEPEQLRLGVMALTMNGHDPYRDPAKHSPLRQVRWISARSYAVAQTLIRAIGMEVAPTFDPAGMVVTGELIPVRCTNAVLAALDDYDAMFDGVRELIAAADIAVAPLEHPLTDQAELTPCRRTVIFTGSHRAVPAIANAGFDVVLTIGNHMLDCWRGCSGIAALRETLTRLHAVGLVTAGAGENLEAARTPALAQTGTAEDSVSFAFLGYDIIAPWYAATDERPGVAPLTARSVREDIKAAQQLADHVIVGANWGTEYVSNPNRFQRDIGGIVMDAGATLLIGNHPHWVQAVEHVDDGLVAYSFGNFVFDQNWSVPTTQGMLMELGFTAERLLGYRIRPVVIRGGSGVHHSIYRPEFVNPAGEGRAILRRIWQAQDRLPKRAGVSE